MASMDELLAGVYSATITEAAVLVREVRVRIGVLTKWVTIRVYYDHRRSEPYSFETSALMKPAKNRDARNELVAAISENEALRLAVRMLTEDYEEAVRRGELPEDGWLVQTLHV